MSDAQQNQDTPITSLSLPLAMAIAQGTLAAAREMGCRPMTVVVLDAGGHTKLVLREDGSGHFGVPIATAKAGSVVGFGARTSRSLQEVFASQTGLAAALAGVADGRFMPAAGGVRVMSAEGVLLGAAAASGDSGDRDEAVVLAGLQAAGVTG